MKTICLPFFILTLSLFTISCEKSKTEINDEPIEISFNLNIPYITSHDELITRTGASNNYIYAMRIEEYNTNTSSYTPYAFGVFDDISKAKIPLSTNKKYNIEAGVINNFFESGNMFVGGGGTHSSVDNSFKMNFGLRLNEWWKQNVWEDSYYGKITDYYPSDNGLCKIDLSSQTTGVKMVVSGIHTGEIRFLLDGYLPIPLSLYLDEGLETESLLTIDSMFGSNSETFNKRIIIQYVDAKNSTTNIFEQNCTFTKGYKKVFDIKLNGSGSDIESGFELSFTQPILTDEEAIHVEGTL